MLMSSHGGCGEAHEGCGGGEGKGPKARNGLEAQNPEIQTSEPIVGPLQLALPLIQ